MILALATVVIGGGEPEEPDGVAGVCAHIQAEAAVEALPAPAAGPVPDQNEVEATCERHAAAR